MKADTMNQTSGKGGLFSRLLQLASGCKASQPLASPGLPVTIMTGLHCLYMARMLQAALEKAGFPAEISTCEPLSYTDRMYIVICPQIFRRLPPHYIAYQAEQLVADRWMTAEYFRILSGAHSVLDYSVKNIAFFERNNALSGKKVYYVPVDYMSGNCREASEYEFDVAFYGETDSPHRKSVLDELQRHFSVKIIHGVYGEELYDILRRTRVLVNIHYYEKSLLEMGRIYEVLSLGRSVVVSEHSTDPEEEARLEGIVRFVDGEDPSAMVEEVRRLLSEESSFRAELEKNNALLAGRSNLFEKQFYLFLQENGWLSEKRLRKLTGSQF